MRALSARPFCPCDDRWVSLRYLSAGLRYTTNRCSPQYIPLALEQRVRLDNGLKRVFSKNSRRDRDGRDDAFARVEQTASCASSRPLHALEKRTAERLLTDEEVGRLRQRAIDAVAAAHGAELRT